MGSGSDTRIVSGAVTGTWGRQAFPFSCLETSLRWQISPVPIQAVTTHHACKSAFTDLKSPQSPSPCLSLPSAEIQGVYHCGWRLKSTLFFNPLETQVKFYPEFYTHPDVNQHFKIYEICNYLWYSHVRKKRPLTRETISKPLELEPVKANCGKWTDGRLWTHEGPLCLALQTDAGGGEKTHHKRNSEGSRKQERVKLKAKAGSSVCYPSLSQWLWNWYSMLTSALIHKTKGRRTWGWWYFNSILPVRWILLLWSTYSWMSNSFESIIILRLIVMY